MTMLTNEDLAEIKRKLNHHLATGDDMFRVILDIAERVRAESQLDRYREIVRRVAEDDIAYRDPAYEYEHCFWCPAGDRVNENVSDVKELQHTAECPVLKARALLANASDKQEL